MFWWKSRPGELSYNSSISNNLAEMINFPIQIPAWDSHILTLELFLSFDTSICSAPSIWNPLFSINFHSNSKGEGGGGGWSFPLQSFWLYSCWFRWFSWSSKRRISLIILVLLLLLPNFVSIQVGIDICLPHWKYQDKPHSAACPATTAHRINFFKFVPTT